MGVRPLRGDHHKATRSPIVKDAARALEEYCGPQSVGRSPVGMLLDVEDVDQRFARAMAAGAEALKPVSDRTVAVHQEDVAPEEP